MRDERRAVSGLASIAQRHAATNGAAVARSSAAPEQDLRGAQVRAVVRGVEAVDEAGESVARRLLHPTQAGSGAELEQPGLLGGGDRERPLERRRGSDLLAARRRGGEQAFAPQPMQLGLVDALARFSREGEGGVEIACALATSPAARWAVARSALKDVVLMRCPVAA